MCQSIRGQGGHIGFPIDFKITTLGRGPTRNICAKFGSGELKMYYHVHLQDNIKGSYPQLSTPTVNFEWVTSWSTSAEVGSSQVIIFHFRSSAEIILELFLWVHSSVISQVWLLVLEENLVYYHINVKILKYKNTIELDVNTVAFTPIYMPFFSWTV